MRRLILKRIISLLLVLCLVILPVNTAWAYDWDNHEDFTSSNKYGILFHYRDEPRQGKLGRFAGTYKSWVVDTADSNLERGLPDNDDIKKRNYIGGAWEWTRTELGETKVEGETFFIALIPTRSEDGVWAVESHSWNDTKWQVGSVGGALDVCITDSIAVNSDNSVISEEFINNSISSGRSKLLLLNYIRDIISNVDLSVAVSSAKTGELPKLGDYGLKEDVLYNLLPWFLDNFTYADIIRDRDTILANSINSEIVDTMYKIYGEDICKDAYNDFIKDADGNKLSKEEVSTKLGGSLSSKEDYLAAIHFMKHGLRDEDFNESIQQENSDSTITGQEAATQLNEWYKLAYAVATDNRSGYDDLVQADADFGNWETLLNFARNGDTEVIRRVYDIICLAFTGSDDIVNQYGLTEDILKESYNIVREKANGVGVLQSGLSTYESIVERLNALSASTQDDEWRRMASFYDRMIGLYYISTLNISASDSNLSEYSWMDEYYENSNKTTIDKDEVTNGEMLLSFGGTDAGVYGYPAFNEESDSKYSRKALVYMIETIWELPYIRDYIIEDMNKAVASSTILQSKERWNALNSIAKAVEEFNIPMLNRQWEKETSKDVKYKSLKSLYEVCKNSDELKDNEDIDNSYIAPGKPLSEFMDYNSGQFSEYYRKGIEYSSTLVPMQSNLYSQEWMSYLDEDFKKHFYQLWGFNRKALFIDKTSGSAEGYFTSSSRAKANLKVCTLEDLLKCDRDIVLYIDDDLYNVHELAEVLEKPGVSADNENWTTTMADKVDDAFKVDIEQITKNGDSNNYSLQFYEYMSKTEGSHVYYPDATEKNVGNEDGLVLSSGKINYYLKEGETGSKEYSPMQGYAVTSAVYRDSDLFNYTTKLSTKQPVFISSNKAPYMKNSSMEAKQTIYNYMLLKNIKASMPVGYSNSIDMSCPVYMDIFGNIVTESGTVVVPAAANATLMGDNYYNVLWNAGLFSIYGSGFKLPVGDDKSLDDMLSTAFTQDNGVWIPTPRTLNDDVVVDMSRLSTTNKTTLDTIMKRFSSDMYNLDSDGYEFDRFFQICMEVLRGAPLENIDKTAEGLGMGGTIDKAGIVAAMKLEELTKQLNTGKENTVLSFPNIAFMDGLSYVVLLLFKAIVLVLIVINMITIYTDAVGAHIGWSTAWKCILSIVLTFVVVVGVPTIFNITYYQSNRALLQDETAYISMLNLEKEQAGVEIGVTEIREPESNTKLYLKLDDINIKWYDLLYDIMFAGVDDSLQSLYKEYADDSLIQYNMDVITKNNGVYVDVNDIYNSSSIDLSIDESGRRILKQTAKVKTNTFSKYSPYYAILDALIRHVNYYNENPWGEEVDSSTSLGWYSYSIKSQKGGKLKTMGLIAPYFKSSAFMEDNSVDTLGLYRIYDGFTESDYEPDPSLKYLYSEKNLASMRNTAWFASGMNSEEIQKRIVYLNNYARKFVADNVDMIGKISDETFLKVMALTVAIKYNQTFGVNCASSFEIYNLSEDDLIKLFIADTPTVMVNSFLSYPRFVYEVGGTPAVFAGALLAMIMWVSSIVKPLCVLATFGVIFASIFIFKICLRKNDTSLYGYVITTLLLAGVNILYSVLLKLSVYLPNMGLTPLMCILLQIILQIGYMAILLGVVWFAIRDWRDLGYSRAANKMQVLYNKKVNTFYGGTEVITTPEQNWEFYNELMERRRKI